MEDLKQIFKHNYLHYASYVILDRAIPNIADGLKPVQRRILWTLFQMDDGKLHKVANVAGQTMALHPHGDGPITDALVNLANKGFLLDRQGNFGNPFTGDPAAASRYIETRLSSLSKETLFNPNLTEFITSYDSRKQEPLTLPAKIPLLLMQGAEGIAVGMSTRILSHNFTELLEAEIAILENKSFQLLPDFSSGGIMDASDYQKGKGKIRLRAKIVILDEKTLMIREICHGTTTESVIRSIDEAAKRGKIKIDAIHDYTAECVEIEIKLPRGVYANTAIDALYAFTECQVTLNSQVLVIRDEHPWETTVDEVLKIHTEQLVGYLKTELELEKAKCLDKVFEKNLEQIFIENRLYKKIETIGSYDKIHTTIEESLAPYLHILARVPNHEDREKLLEIPIRRISRFDIERNQTEILQLEERIKDIEKNLKNITRYTIRYIQNLLKKYGAHFPRRTVVQEIEELDVRELSKKKVRIGYDSETGFLGLKVSNAEAIECTSLDKLLIVYADGHYTVINIPEKQYIHTQGELPLWIGPADKKTPLSVLYTDRKTHYPYVKRFIIKQFILDKIYNYLDPGMKLEFFSARPDPKVELHFLPKKKQKLNSLKFGFKDVAIKNISSKGQRIANKELKMIKLIKEQE